MVNKEGGVIEKKVVVTGDVTVDCFELLTPSVESQNISGKYKYNWQSYPGVINFAHPGGALLLADFVKHASGARIVSPEISNFEAHNPDRAIHAYARIESYPYSVQNPHKEVFRLKDWKGFSATENIKPLTIDEDTAKADIVVLDDSGNGFRDYPAAWENVISGNKSAFVVLKMSRPLGEGKLWNTVAKSKNPLILIIEADDLRAMDVKISRCLSWERTAQDLAWQIAYNRYIEFLHVPDYLVVRFGADGAVLYNNKDKEFAPKLFFDPKVEELGFASLYPGKMVGIGDAFTAGLVAELLQNSGQNGLEGAVREGITCMRKLWQSGFGSNIESLTYQYKDIFNPQLIEDHLIAETVIPEPTPEPDQHYWCILEELPTFVEQIAFNSVVTGKDESLEKVPLGQFGNLITLDRSEIESFSSIKNLINEYLKSPTVKRPISIGVFGPPGSGKSFGVTEVVKSIDPGKVPDKPLEFNLSQFNSLDDLITAFHKIRDVSLQGVVPLVFFDEFDSEFQREKLGWLKYFLAPMQDGLFRDGEAVHPIGKGIFVFAGGTRSTFEEFSEQQSNQVFRDAKGSDFVSRLRGYINIKGPNPVKGNMQNDRLSMIRRATVLRFLLKKNAPQIFKAGKLCQIDRDVLQAFIKVPYYKHGIRSMESIIEMSSLAGRKKYEQAALPSPEQLELHVNAEIFQRIVVRDVIFRAARKRIAEAIHEKYRINNQKKKPKDDLAMLPWNKLPSDLKDSNLEQADHIPQKLQLIKCDFIPVTGREIELFKFKESEIELLAELEHERFMEEKKRQGWVQGEKRDNNKKIRTDLIPWNELEEEIKDLDRDAVKAIPELLAQAGLEIYRMD